jgi:hypothetical protein
MNYLDRVALDIAAIAQPCEMPSETDLVLYRIYAVLGLAKGQAVTKEDVHNAWAAWTSTYRPGHASLVPFAELSPLVQSLDQPYVNAIHQAVARAGA